MTVSYAAVCCQPFCPGFVQCKQLLAFAFLNQAKTIIFLQALHLIALALLEVKRHREKGESEQFPFIQAATKKYISNGN